MTKDLKKVSKDVVEDDGKTVEMTGTHINSGVGPLLGLELTSTENKGKNITTPINGNTRSQMFLVCSPLLGTRDFQHTVIVGKSSKRRFQNSVCYTHLLHNWLENYPHSPKSSADNGSRICYTNLLHNLPIGMGLKEKEN